MKRVLLKPDIVLALVFDVLDNAFAVKISLV